MNEPARNPRKRCLVLGGSGHVGSAAVELLAAEGVDVLFSYHANAERAQALAQRTGAHAFALDVRDPEQLDALPARVDAALGEAPLDGLIQCIGTAGDPALYRHRDGLEKFAAIDAAGWDEMQSLTVTSTFRALQVLAPRLNQGANVVVLGSIDGSKSVPAPVHYAAAKAALGGLVRSAAKALGPRGVSVNLLAPGLLDGGLVRDVPPDLMAEYVKHSALKRVGTAEEVARWIGWLVLFNTYLTGQTLVLDGGL